jgi:membrane-anchored protein YejM (alkaline phosphatase superfamily)
MITKVKFRLLMILLMPAAVFLLAGCSAPPPSYNIVFITMDTTRSDYVDTGNGAKAFTPELKQFARKAVVFDHAFSAIPQTLPSHLVMLTSYYPHECGVYSNENIYDGRHKMLQEVLKEKGYTTAAVISLGTLGGNTGINKGFDQFHENLNGKTVFFTRAEKVTAEGIKLLNEIKKNKFFLFLHYSDPHSPYAPPSTRSQARFCIEIDGKPILDFDAYQGAILRQDLEIPNGSHNICLKVDKHPEDFDYFVIRRLTSSENCQLTFQNISFSKNYYGGSYIVKAPGGNISVKSRGKGNISIFQVIPILSWKACHDYYRMEVEYMDRYIGKFLSTLEKENLLANSIVLITADHGEGLGERERYFGHVRYLNQQFIHIPFMIYIPGIKPKHEFTPVSLIGISPTILECLGFRENRFRFEESLLSTIKEKHYNDNIKKPIYSFAFSPSSVNDRLSVIQWPYQCIFNKYSPDTVEQELYQLALSQSYRKWDEFSVEVLIKESKNDYVIMQQSYQQLSSVFAKNTTAKSKGLSFEESEKLKTMGYLQ